MLWEKPVFVSYIARPVARCCVCWRIGFYIVIRRASRAFLCLHGFDWVIICALAAVCPARHMGHTSRRTTEFLDLPEITSRFKIRTTSLTRCASRCKCASWRCIMTSCAARRTIFEWRRISRSCQIEVSSCDSPSRHRKSLCLFYFVPCLELSLLL